MAVESVVNIQLCMAATMAMVLINFEVVNIMTISISSTWRTDIAVSTRCAFTKNILHGLLTLRVY